MHKNKYYPSAEKSTPCVCPRCGIKHKMLMYWTGRGTPRKHCPVCVNYIKYFGGGIDDQSEFHKRTISMGR